MPVVVIDRQNLPRGGYLMPGKLSGPFVYQHLAIQPGDEVSVYSWSTSSTWDEANQDWLEFCENSGREAMNYLEGIHPESDVVPQYRETIWYQIEVLGKDDYRE